MATAGVALLVVPAGSAVAVPWMRWSVDKRRNRVELILEGLIDQDDR